MLNANTNPQESDCVGPITSEQPDIVDRVTSPDPSPKRRKGTDDDGSDDDGVVNDKMNGEGDDDHENTNHPRHN